MNKNVSVLSFAIPIIILIRCVFDNHKGIVYIVAGINIVAIAFVIYTIVEKILSNVIENIKKSKVPTQIIKREIKLTRLKIWGVSLIVGIVITIVYFTWWCSGVGNDIISILALGISVIDDDIVKVVTDNYKI